MIEGDGNEFPIVSEEKERNKRKLASSFRLFRSFNLFRHLSSLLFSPFLRGLMLCRRRDKTFGDGRGENDRGRRRTIGQQSLDDVFQVSDRRDVYFQDKRVSSRSAMA